MPAKRGKKVKKDEISEEPQKIVPGISEVEKVFLEQKLADSNRKVARLKLEVEEYENRNEELQNAYNKLDVDRADIIAYLRRTVNQKNEENIELKDNVKDLEELRVKEMAQFKASVEQLEKRFTIMKDRLTAENKLLAGKFNTMDEFKAMRDDLMKKFEDLEQAFKELDMKHKRTIYDADKKFVTGKDKLKKEMEARLLQLAQDFQNVSELRIAASTHRVLRENIAVNYEINNILTSQSKLSEQNKIFREKEKDARMAKEIAEDERDRAIEKNIVLIKVLNKLKTVYKETLKEKDLYEKKTFDFAKLEEQVCKITNENRKQGYKIRWLEQRLHAKMCDDNKYTVELSKAIAESKRLKDVIRQAAIVVQATLNLDKKASKGAKEATADPKELLPKLLRILNQFRDIQKADSIETLDSFGQLYEQGDLGFLPKLSVTMKPKLSQTDEMVKTITDLSSDSVSFTDSLASIRTIPSLDVLPPLEIELEREKSSSESIDNIEIGSATLTLDTEQSENGKMDKELDQSLKTSEINKELNDTLMENSSIKEIADLQEDNLLASESMKFYKKGSDGDERKVEENDVTNHARNTFENENIQDRIDESTQKTNGTSKEADEISANK